MPSAGKRFSVRMASGLSSGGPQMPFPVMRMAPKPRRWISISPPTLNDPDLRASSLDIFVFSQLFRVEDNASTRTLLLLSPFRTCRKRDLGIQRLSPQD